MARMTLTRARGHSLGRLAYNATGGTTGKWLDAADCVPCVKPAGSALMRSSYPRLAFLALTVFETGAALAIALCSDCAVSPALVSFITEGNLDSIDTLVCVFLSGVFIRRVGVFLNVC